MKIKSELVWKHPDELTLSPNNVRKYYHDKEIQKITLAKTRKARYRAKNGCLGQPEFWDTLNKTRLASLVENVSQKGVIVPILINQHNQIVAGQRRWLAAKKAGLQSIPCIVKNYENPIEEICDSLAENEGHEILDEIDKYFALKELRNKYGLSIRQISSHTGIPKSTVHDLLWHGDLQVSNWLLTVPGEYYDVRRKMKKTQQKIAKNMIESLDKPTSEQITRIIDYCFENPVEVIRWEKKQYGTKKLAEKIVSRPDSDTRGPIIVSFSVPRDMANRLLPLLKRKKMNIITLVLFLLNKFLEGEDAVDSGQSDSK